MTVQKQQWWQNGGSVLFFEYYFVFFLLLQMAGFVASNLTSMVLLLSSFSYWSALLLTTCGVSQFVCFCLWDQIFQQRDQLPLKSSLALSKYIGNQGNTLYGIYRIMQLAIKSTYQVCIYLAGAYIVDQQEGLFGDFSQ